MERVNVKKNVLTALRKALESGGDGAALNPYDLDPILHEELLKIQPLATLLEVEEANGKTHEYNARTSHPMAWFEGETTPQNPKSGVYARKSVQMKIQRIWGEVTNFAQVVDEPFIDALATELEGSVEGMANTLEYGQMWGCANDIGFTGDAYQYSGIIPRILAFAPGNVVDAGGNKIDLADLDDGLDQVTFYRGVENDPKLWVMTNKMKTKVDGLQTAIQLPLTEAELFDGKIIMSTYGETPILKSSYMGGGTSSPSDLGALEDDGGGSLAADTYYYNISSVTMFGECIAGTEANVATVGGGDAVDLSWTADANAVLYLIWRGLATGNANLQLLDIIPALTYDTAGTVNGTVATYKDTGAKTPIAVKPLSAGEQNILLVNRSPRRGVTILGLVDQNGRPVENLFRYVELAQVKDTYPYMVKGYLSSKLIYPNLHALIRHAKLA